MSGILKIEPRTLDGFPCVTAIPGIDPTSMCFCQGVSGKVSVAVPFIEWVVSYEYIQIAGLSLWVEGGEKYDTMDFEVGYYHPITEEFVVISCYGENIPIIVSSFYFHKEAQRVSNPIPQGLVLRISYVFKNPETANQPDIAAIYHLQRPYA